MTLIEKVKRHGVIGSMQKAPGWVKFMCLWRYNLWRCRNAPVYANPTAQELSSIEHDLKSLGIKVDNLTLTPTEFKKFKTNRGSD